MSNANEPDIKIELLFGKDKLLEAKSEVEKFIVTIRSEIDEYKGFIAEVEVRKDHFNKLIDEGKFNKSAMEKALTMMDVEIRKHTDIISGLTSKKNQYRVVIENIDEKLVEAEKWESSSTTQPT